jgi:hypothetical protein
MSAAGGSRGAHEVIDVMMPRPAGRKDSGRCAAAKKTARRQTHSEAGAREHGTMVLR